MSELHSRETEKDLEECAAIAERLALAIYRLTDRFPEHEVLRERMRSIALDIVTVLAATPKDVFDQTHGAIAAMLGLMAIARPQHYTSDENFALLSQHYGALDDAVRRQRGGGQRREQEVTAPVEKESPSITEAIAETSAAPQALTKRQQKIAIHFKSKPSFQLREVRQLFEGYSQKTLRNDLKELCRLGILDREGVGTVSHYRVVREIPSD